ncbi:MAG: winged helix-turn-helix transcriptional regulator [Anaerolineales bacterium]|nr:winged helix-turn-helix transcriptional regulator [Anaerolineales bacterium]
MPFPILLTKLYPPLPAEGFVHRHSLMDRVQAGINGRITIISAPPGFGKTTLLSVWISNKQNKKVAWYSLDEDDNEPGRFFAYIAASLRPLEPDSVLTLDSLLEAGFTNPRELTVALLHDLSEFVSTSVVLVLDDYHHITSQAIHDAVAYLIDHLPSNIHLVFISRVDPPLPLGRWRVRGQLTEIRADDLRFKKEEAAQFLIQTMGLSLSAEDIRTLEARTEGWVAGLQLAALTLQKSTNSSEIISAFAGSNRYVADYLTDEVLSRQPETLRDFLLKTSILERFNASLCDQVLQSEQSESLLAELERANLFIIPLDSESNWYRYHHLFADLLKRRASTETTDLHRRAAEWFEKNNFLLDAIRHWIAADEPDRVASLVEHSIAHTWGQAELAGLMRRIESLPEPILAKYPALSAFLGWMWLWLGYGSERILPLLDRAEKNLGAESDTALGRFNVIRSFIVRIRDNDASDSVRLGRLSLSQLSADDSLWRGFANMSIAISLHSSGHLIEGEDAYKETIRLCEQGGDPITALMAACAMTQLLFDCGDLQRALSFSQQMANGLREKTSTSLVRGWVHINKARAYYLVNDLKNAWLEANRTLDLETQTGGMPDVGLRLYALLTKLELLNGNESAACKAADDLVALANRGGVTNAIDWAHAVHAELMFRLKDWAAFDSYARMYRPPQQPLFFPYRLQTLLQVRYLARQKAWDEGRRLVEEQVRLAREAGYVEYEMELHIVHALMEQEAGKSSVAFKTLERALEIGKTNGYVRVFLDEGDGMKSLLAQIQKSRKDDFVADLLSAFGKSVHIDQSSLIEPLTEREIDVLKLIAEGLSNPEIAEKLFLSVGTVKTHVKHIYGKLNVDDRVKAASKARELKLLG